MIQRIQTVFLFMASAFAATLFFAHSLINKKDDTMSADTGEITCGADIFNDNYFKEERLWAE